MSEFKQIFIANSVYAEFLYLLRFPEKTEETLFLVGPSCVGIDVPNRLPIASPKDKQNLPFFREFLSLQTYLLLKGVKVPCYGNVETVFSQFFVDNFPFYPITDGLWDIKKFPVYLENPTRFKKCYAVKYAGGLDVEHERLEYLNVPSLWEKFTQEEKIKFVERFGIKNAMFSELSRRTMILVTQPLSEDGIISENEKIRLYKAILSQYNPSDLIIKPHPREYTKWEEIFPEIPVIPKLVPAELVALNMPEIKKMITFFSTSACTVFPANQIDFYAKDFAKLRMMDNNRLEDGVVYRPAAAFDVEILKKKSNFNWFRIPDQHFYKD